jgi:hypothetical protein
VTLSLDASLRGTEGPLPAGPSWSAEMRTYGPLDVVSAGCGQGCDAGESIRVRLSNDVALADLRRHLAISPPVPLDWGDFVQDAKASEFWVHPKTLPGRAYTLTVTAGLTDRYGQTLARDLSRPIEVRDLSPRVAVGLDGSVLEAALAPASRVVPVSSVNQAS